MLDAFLSQGPIFILSLAFMLGLVVVIHELGHYWAGRFFGAAVESFSVGFGTSIWERTDRNGTRWRINWIPLGGFVKFVGESQLPGDVGKTEQGPVGKPYGQLGVGARSVVSIAGPLANFVLAVLLFSLIAAFNGTNRSEVEVTALEQGGPAALGGIEVGDVLLEVNGNSVRRPSDVPRHLLMTAGENVEIAYRRDGVESALIVVPEQRVRDNGLGQMQPQATIAIGIRAIPGTMETRSLGPVEAVGEGLNQTGFVLNTTVTLMGRLVTGKEPLDMLSGPVAIGDTGRRLYNRTLGQDQGAFWTRFELFVWNLLGISAAVSIGIGFFNLLPLPILDGGHLVFNAYEAVMGRALPEKVQEMALMAGLGLLMTLFVFITWGDIVETGLFGGTNS